MKNLLLALSFLLAAPLAFAADYHDWRYDVVSHPAVTALTQLMNATHSKTCVAPKEEDLWVGCTGALPTVKKPQIANVPCFFKLEIKCNGGSAQISGERQQHVLVLPGGVSPQAIEPEIIIEDVKLQ